MGLFKKWMGDFISRNALSLFENKLTFRTTDLFHEISEYITSG